MRTSDFSYHLPQELIAQTPVEPRDASRLLVVERATGALEHRVFRDLPALLEPGDLLVFNDSRVIPARLRGRRLPTGGRVEVLLLHRVEPGTWQALVRPGNRLRTGAAFLLERGERRVEGRVVGEEPSGARLIRLESEEELEALGETPLPPYITTPLADPERYQTVYARIGGSAASPTAGLHFTPGLLRALEEKGVGLAFLTLHIGLGTFQPVRAEDPRRHRLEAEYFTLPEETARQVWAAKAAGRRVVCVGTTSLRALEEAALLSRVGEEGRGAEALRAFSGWTELFILPGYRFLLADALVTNFHLPRSTLLMLVAAFAGKELVDRAYAEAVQERYRFYSFGDCMLIV